MTAIKICGLTRTEDARAAERAGASYLGVILAGGPRLIDLDRARDVLGPRRPSIQRVAIFGERNIVSIIADADRLDLDVMQLHGDPTPEQVTLIRTRSGRAVWPVLRVEGTVLSADAIDLASSAGALVLDAKVVGQLGGTGVALEWNGLRDAVEELRTAVPGLTLIVAGGLRDSNVARAMALLAPNVVDVSSGVESAPGIKVSRAIEQFIAAVSTAKGTR